MDKLNIFQNGEKKKFNLHRIYALFHIDNCCTFYNEMVKLYRVPRKIIMLYFCGYQTTVHFVSSDIKLFVYSILVTPCELLSINQWTFCSRIY